METNLKHNIILVVVSSLLSALMTSAGFVVDDYFNEENRSKAFVEGLYKGLYDKYAMESAKLANANSNLVDTFGTKYGLTTYELEESYLELRAAVKSYQQYIGELERYGNSEQIKVAKGLGEWIRRLYAEFDLQYKLAERTQKEVRKLLLVEDKSSYEYKTLDKYIDSSLEELIQNENRIYYETIFYMSPVIHGIEQYLNYQFRISLGLDATEDMAKSINEIPVLIEHNPEYKYGKKKHPFAFAENRAFQAPTLELPVLEDMSSQKNDILKEKVKIKFISSILAYDPEFKGVVDLKKHFAQHK